MSNGKLMKMPGEYRLLAKNALTGKWGSGAVVVFISLLFSSLGIIFGCCMYEVCEYVLNIVDGKKAETNNTLNGFKGERLITNVFAGILSIFVISAGYCLFVLPGIVLSLGFSMVFFVIHDNPKLDAISAMKESWRIMDGHKHDLFMLLVQFIVLGIAVLFSCFFGIGIFLMPVLVLYIYTSMAFFYRDLVPKDMIDDEKALNGSDEGFDENYMDDEDYA